MLNLSEFLLVARLSSIKAYQNPASLWDIPSPQSEILLSDNAIMGASSHTTHKYTGVEFESASAPGDRHRLEIGPIPHENRADTLIKTRIRLTSVSGDIQTSTTDYQSVLIMTATDTNNWKASEFSFIMVVLNPECSFASVSAKQRHTPAFCYGGTCHKSSSYRCMCRVCQTRDKEECQVQIESATRIVR
jgi:hypothetical protein